jgi:hypothetical protein
MRDSLYACGVITNFIIGQEGFELLDFIKYETM